VFKRQTNPAFSAKQTEHNIRVCTQAERLKQICTGLYTHLSDECWEKREGAFLRCVTLNTCSAGHRGNYSLCNSLSKSASTGSNSVLTHLST